MRVKDFSGNVRIRNGVIYCALKKGVYPFVAEEYRNLKELEKNYTEKYIVSKEDKRRKKKEKNKDNDMFWHDYVTGIDYNGFKTNLAEYGERKDKKENGVKKTAESTFWFITDLPVTKRNIEALIQRGRMRWFIENKGFNTQKKHGYYIEHMFSKNYQAIKNHYFLIQIGHMISQIMEAWEKIWKNIKQSMEQKHRRILDSFKITRLKEYKEELQTCFQVRFT